MRPAPPSINRALRALDLGGRPILICGHERSGTTWIAATLGQAPGALWYSEPAGTGATGAPLDVQVAYVPAGTGSEHFEAALDPAFAGLLTEPRRWSVKTRRMLRRLAPGYTIVVKEVATMMMVEWVADRYDPRMLLPVRHPCPVVLSQLDRGNWAPAWLDVMLRDDRLMADHLAPFRSLMERAVSPVESTAVLWAARNRVMADQLDRHNEWDVLAYEDLARRPVPAFRALYRSLGLRWTGAVQRYVEATTTRPGRSRYDTSRVSVDHVDRWRTTMAAADLKTVEEAVEPFDLPWYRAADGAYELAS